MQQTNKYNNQRNNAFKVWMLIIQAHYWRVGWYGPVQHELSEALSGWIVIREKVLPMIDSYYWSYLSFPCTTFLWLLVQYETRRQGKTFKSISFMIELESCSIMTWEVRNVAGVSFFWIFHPTHSSKLDRVPRSPYFVKLGNQYLLEEDGQIASFFLGGFRLSLDPKSRARQPHFFQTQAFLWPPVLHNFLHFYSLLDTSLNILSVAILAQGQDISNNFDICLS